MEYILDFKAINHSSMALVGGKGANLGELYSLSGIHVPQGFCITTEVFHEVTKNNKEFQQLLEELPESSKEIRALLEKIDIPEHITNIIRANIEKLGWHDSYAIRSSATAEDLPTASFAGQQDTYLNICGIEAILDAVKRCFASLFTDRAVMYRIQNNFDHKQVFISVIVQKMIQSEVSGIMFTADPVTHNRKVVSIDASFGLGEALVSGLVSSDLYKVYKGRIISKKIGTKKIIITSCKDGGTIKSKTDHQHQLKQALTDDQIRKLYQIGLKIQKHFKCPQDIEWALDNRGFHIVQSRPITTLYPMIESKDRKSHIYICMGYSQMMTDPMKPLGLSFFPLFGNEFSMPDAGGRLYLDSSADLAPGIGKFIYSKAMNAADPYFCSIIDELTQRKDFMKNLYHEKKVLRMNNSYFSPKMPIEFLRILIQKDSRIVPELFHRSEKRMEELKKEYDQLTGVEVIDHAPIILKKMQEVMYDYKVVATIFAGVYAQFWVNQKAKNWAGIQKVADVFSGTVTNNITSNMGFDLLDVSDIIRRNPLVVKYLEHPSNTAFLEELEKIEDSKDAVDAIKNFLSKYGVRCTGEIDITRPRFYERPVDLVPLILNNIKSQEKNARKKITHKRHSEARRLEKELLSKLSQKKARKMKQYVKLMCNIIGFREYPKFNMMQCYWTVKSAFLREAQKLVEKGALKDVTDIYYLTIDEFRKAIQTGEIDDTIINKRKEEFKQFDKLTPPRVITSEGECFLGRLNKKIPKRAIAGLAVSSGTVTGHARVVYRMEDANIKEGEILVTRFTDPSWTPVFVTIAGLVTEVGGQMTHGSVIAREYGIPAVVSVNNATTLIKNGDKIRVNGTDGYVEIIS